MPVETFIGTAEAVTEAYCMLQGFVNERVFEFQHASDCFCNANEHKDNVYWRSDPEVYAFIREAVMEKIDRMPKFKVTVTKYVDAIDKDDALRRFEHFVDTDSVPVDVTEVTK